MSRSTAAVLAIATTIVLGALTTPSPALADSPSPSADEIVVRVAGLRSNKGSVRCSLYNGAEGFPTAQKHVIARARVVPADKAATCKFTRPERGQKYAVVIHHDENDDGVFQQGPLGIPLEGYGFSKNVRPVLSAPSFEACQFLFAGGLIDQSVTALY